MKIAVRLVHHALPDGELLNIQDFPKHAKTVPTSECEEYLEHYSTKKIDPYSTQLFDRTFERALSENVASIFSHESISK